MGEQDTLQRCLQGEEASLDMNNARDCVLRIGRIGVAMRDGVATCPNSYERVITNPEVVAKRKTARNVMKKQSRKRKNRAFA